jgi:predicted NodU family carbamoyl transferase
LVAVAPITILGVSAYSHDSTAPIVIDGEPVAAAQEERFSRRKHDARFPKNLIACCPDEAGTTRGDVSHIAFYHKPLVKFERSACRSRRSIVTQSRDSSHLRWRSPGRRFDSSAGSL